MRVADRHLCRTMNDMKKNEIDDGLTAALLTVLESPSSLFSVGIWNDR